MFKTIIAFCVGQLIRIMPQRVKRYFSCHLDAIKLMLDGVHGSDYIIQQMKIASLISSSITLSNKGEYEESERCLLQAALVAIPADPQIAPHLGRVRFLKKRSQDLEAESQTKSLLTSLASMNHELEKDPLYVPGEFWKGFGKAHVQVLERYGIENFKRTVSHHYQNYFMDSYNDPQVRQLFKTWTANLTTEPWMNTIEIPDHVGMPFKNDVMKTPMYRLANREALEIYRVSVGLLWEYVKKSDSFNVLEKLPESEIGNPIRIWRKGQLISSDIAHSVRERNMLLQALQLKGNECLIVGELGAGHGRLAEIFGRSTNYRHFIFDITPALYVSQWYISALFPNEKVFKFRPFDDFEEIRDELQECRFAFFTSNQIEKIPKDYFNLFINMNSLAEMRLDQINNFLGHIDRVTEMAFLSRQEVKSLNEVELVPLNKSNFAMPSRWRLVVDKLDDIYPDYFNQIWQR